jgi:hypothetical protein
MQRVLSENLMVMKINKEEPRVQAGTSVNFSDVTG